MFKKKEKLITDRGLIGMVIVGCAISLILILGFAFGLPIFLAIKYSAWWLLLMIVTIPIGLIPLILFANKGDDKNECLKAFRGASTNS